MERNIPHVRMESNKTTSPRPPNTQMSAGYEPEPLTDGDAAGEKTLFAQNAAASLLKRSNLSLGGGLNPLPPFSFLHIYTQGIHLSYLFIPVSHAGGCTPVCQWTQICLKVFFKIN